MGVVLAVLAPGQGSQTPGQLLPWLEVPGVREDLAGWSEAAGVDLLHAGTQLDADGLRDTAVAQPLLVATSLAAARLVPVADVIVGHSVGEWTAAARSGALTAVDAVALVGVRGRAMAAACGARPTGMSAVLGGDRAEVLAALAALGLEAANDNGPGQLVAAGPVEALARLAAAPPGRSRVRPLAVAGAFHTAAMAPAVPPLEEAAATRVWHDAEVAVLSNADGEPVRAGAQLRRRLVAQVALPVRFDLCLRRLRDLGVTHVVELAPAGTLAAIARRALPEAEVVAVTSPEQVAAALAQVHA